MDGEYRKISAKRKASTGDAEDFVIPCPYVGNWAWGRTLTDGTPISDGKIHVELAANCEVIHSEDHVEAGAMQLGLATAAAVALVLSTL